MRRRAALIAAVLVAVAAVVVLVLSGGGNDEGAETKTSARAVGLASTADGAAFALLERVEDGRPRAAVAPVDDDGGAIGEPIADVPFDTAAGITVDGDSVLVAGTRTVEGERRLAVARLSSTGKPDRDFGSGGVATIAVGNGDGVARGIVSTPTDGIVVLGDATDGDHHAMALVQLGPDGRNPRVQLADDAAAGGVMVGQEGRAVAAGTDTSDGSAVLARLGDAGRPAVTRSRPRLTGATWRAVATIPDVGTVVIGSGRGDDGRSVVAVQSFGRDDEPGEQQTTAAGAGDAYGAAAAPGPSGRLTIAANGTDGNAPAAYLLTLPPSGKPLGTARRRGPGRVAGVTPEGGMLITHWDGGRQVATFTPR